MAELTITLGNKDYSSWSLRGWLALKQTGADFDEGVVPGPRMLAQMDDEAIIERLTAVRGIGRWTVEMILIFQLERPDVLPVGDLGVRKGFAVAQGGRANAAEPLPEPAAILGHGERWRPFRSVASWYLWRASEMER